jgi:hypothetical protein
VDLRGELTRALTAGDRRSLYTTLLAANVHVAQDPGLPPLALTQRETGQRAVPAFLTLADAQAFWAGAAPGRTITVRQAPFVEVATAAGGMLVDPADLAIELNRTELTYLSIGELPGEFAQWLQELGRLSRSTAEIARRLRQTYVYAMTGRGPTGENRLYLLEKSEDGTMAVACFSSPESLAQFADVRRLPDSGEYQVAFLPGDKVLQTAGGLGAYVLIDPESPWETQLEPTLP